MTASVVATRLAKRYGPVRAVDGVSFTVERGEIFGLVGADGAGKTTTLRMLAGVLTPDGGGASITGLDVVRDLEAVRARISYMPQRFGLYEDLTVDENIRFYADLFGVSAAERRRRASRLVEMAGLGPFGGRLAGQLSGGMKQKLGLACALIHTPMVLLLDEPTTGVDPVSRRDFWSILYALLAEGVAILASTAYLDEAERCHRVGLLHEGRLLACDTPRRLKARLADRVLAVTSPDPRRVRDALAGADGVRTLVLVGDGVHLIVDGAERRAPELAARLRARDAPFDDLQIAQPTVEDLLVATINEGAAGEREGPA
jgi:ABC-2 type transport system ATP-binding protein